MEKEDPRVVCICEALCVGLSDMVAHGYNRIDMRWEWLRREDGKVLDSGSIVIRRGEKGEFLMEVTDKWSN